MAYDYLTPEERLKYREAVLRKPPVEKPAAEGVGCAGWSIFAAVMFAVFYLIFLVLHIFGF